MNIESPCVNICQLDDYGVCLGCFRTLDEIARWQRMTENERSTVMAALAGKKPAPDAFFEVKSNE